MSSQNDTYATLRRKAIKQLTTLAHVPTPFLSAFLVVHLSAPLVANVGGGELSSQVMLLGREYYQRSITTSAILVYTPLALHLLSTYLKRRLLKQSILRPPRPLLSYTAYITAMLLPTHIFVSRYAPTLPQAPISSLGPGELDYEFVKYGLGTWPWRSALLLGGVVCATLVHAVEGWKIMWGTYVKKPSDDLPKDSVDSPAKTLPLVPPHSPSARRNRITLRRLLPAIIPASFVLSGIIVLWLEDPSGSAVLPSTQARLEAVYRRAWWWYW